MPCTAVSALVMVSHPGTTVTISVSVPATGPVVTDFISTMMRGAGASVASAISAHGGTCSAESHHVHQRIRAILLYAGHGVRVIHVDEVHNMRGVSLAASVHCSFNPRRRGHSVVTGYRQEWITLFWFTSVTDVSDSVSVYIGFPSAAA